MPKKTKQGDGWKVVDNTDAFLRSAGNAVEDAITKGTLKVQREAVHLVTRHSGPHKSHPEAVPSKPGEPPHLRTGTLARSIDWETLQTSYGFVGRVGTNLKYGFWLEVGTSQMDARPYLRPALDKHRNKIVSDIRKAMP
jgi:HK97 gp10 family phage protein